MKIIPTATATNTMKRVLFLRHGEAMHNPRAEAARHSGCSFDQFLQLMTEDDHFDAPLTDLGKKQAQSVVLGRPQIYKKLQKIDFVVASPLTRAIHTANLVLNSVSVSNNNTRRISLEYFREFIGFHLHAKRSDKTDLLQKFGEKWDFSFLESESDDKWTTTLEERVSCAERGYQGLLWLLSQPIAGDNILVVTHGGLLTSVMGHPNVQLIDGRNEEQQEQRSVTSRFTNCELREFELTLLTHENDDNERPTILLVEVTDFS